MIYTSYFGGLRKYADELLARQIVPISIAQMKPSWYRGLEYRALAPSKEMLHDYKTNLVYRLDTPFKKKERYILQYYRDILQNLTPEKVAADLLHLAKPRTDVVLLCYEKPNRFCHRQIVADWLKTAGFSIEEINWSGLTGGILP